MTTIISSSNAIESVNLALNDILQSYLNPDPDKNIIDIRFSLPDMNSAQANPCVSVFLYDVHEDLQLRQSEQPRFNPADGAYRAGTVNLSCNYLITFWETQTNGGTGDGPDSKPDNEAVHIMTLILQALLNNREFGSIAGSYSRIIPPQENLNSLGSFWQALGNRPRLSLMYSITVPILLDNKLPQPLIKEITHEITQIPVVDLKELNDVLRNYISQEAGITGMPGLAKVNFESQAGDMENSSADTLDIVVLVSGVLEKNNENAFKTCLDNLVNKADLITLANGKKIVISSFVRDDLLYV